MATRKTKVDLAQVNKVAATAAEVISKQTVDVLLHVTPDELVGPNPEAEVTKGTAYRSGGWLNSPAILHLFAAADQRLTRVANAGGLEVRKAERVQAVLIKGTSLLVLKAAPADDLTALPVLRFKGESGARINLFALLGPAGRTVETGYRERYEIAFVPNGSPLWPGLVIDLSQPQDRRQERSGRKKSQGSAPTAKPAGKE